jgi:hypothetical protein
MLPVAVAVTTQSQLAQPFTGKKRRNQHGNAVFRRSEPKLACGSARLYRKVPIYKGLEPVNGCQLAELEKIRKLLPLPTASAYPYRYNADNYVEEGRGRSLLSQQEAGMVQPARFSP